MKRIFTILISLGILVVGIAIAALLFVTKPEAAQVPEEKTLPIAEFMMAEAKTQRFPIASQGLVQSARRAQLTAEVSGKIISVSEKFEAGMQLQAGEVLLTVDPTDYESIVAQRQSALADARVALETERARSEQALRDWRKLGSGGRPSDFVLRKPQLASAEALVKSAQAALAKAEKDLQRTEITAPFAGTVSMTMVELGTFLAPGTPVAEIFDAESLEVVLPISASDLSFLPKTGGDSSLTNAEIMANIGGSNMQWPAKVMRTQGEIDRTTRTVNLIAAVEQPDELPTNGVRLMQPGLFVKAKLQGKPIDNVIEVPFAAFIDMNRLSVIDSKNRISTRSVDILARNGDRVFVTGGLEPGDRINLTEFSPIIEGMEVEPLAADREKVVAQ